MRQGSALGDHLYVMPEIESEIQSEKMDIYAETTKQKAMEFLVV